jgi:hypothetical protein
LTAAAVRQEDEAGKRPEELGGRKGVGSLVAGPGSDFSEVPVAGCEPAALEPVAAPTCPPGPAAWARASRTIWWEATSESRRFRQRIASRGVFPVATLRS